MSEPGRDDAAAAAEPSVRLRAGDHSLPARVVTERSRRGRHELVVVVADEAEARRLRAHDGPLVLERLDPRGVVEVPVRLDAEEPAVPTWVALQVPPHAPAAPRQRRRWARAAVDVDAELWPLPVDDDEPDPDGSHRVRPLDLSACGMRWRGEPDLPVGTRLGVRLHLPDGTVEGEALVVRDDGTDRGAEVRLPRVAADRVAALVFRTQRERRRRT